MMKLFEDCKIGSIQINNRLVQAPMSINLASDGFITDRMKHFYVERAKGGVGLITVEDGIVEWPRGKNVKNAVGIDDEKYLPKMKEMIKEIKKHGSKVAVQLSHGGRRAGRVSKESGSMEVTEGEMPVAPSAIPHPVPGQVVPKKLTIEEMNDIIEKFGAAARRVKQAGFDGVGLHCAHMYLLEEFLSPWANKRTDEYGGNLDKRLRFVLEVIEKLVTSQNRLNF